MFQMSFPKLGLRLALGSRPIGALRSSAPPLSLQACRTSGTTPEDAVRLASFWGPPSSLRTVYPSPGPASNSRLDKLGRRGNPSRPRRRQGPGVDSRSKAIADLHSRDLHRQPSPVAKNTHTPATHTTMLQREALHIPPDIFPESRPISPGPSFSSPPALLLARRLTGAF